MSDPTFQPNPRTFPAFGCVAFVLLGITVPTVFVSLWRYLLAAKATDHVGFPMFWGSLLILAIGIPGAMFAISSIRRKERHRWIAMLSLCLALIPVGAALLITIAALSGS